MLERLLSDISPEVARVLDGALCGRELSADDALLLHLPIVKGKGRPQPARIEGGRLKYGPDRPRGRGFRFEVGVARPSTGGHETLRAIVEGGYSSSAQISDVVPHLDTNRLQFVARRPATHGVQKTCKRLPCGGRIRQ